MVLSPENLNLLKLLNPQFFSENFFPLCVDHPKGLLQARRALHRALEVINACVSSNLEFGFSLLCSSIWWDSDFENFQTRKSENIFFLKFLHNVHGYSKIIFRALEVVGRNSEALISTVQRNRNVPKNEHYFWTSNGSISAAHAPLTCDRVKCYFFP